MNIKTEALVISSIRYGDYDLIVRLFTQKEGITSYLLKGILKSKKGKLKSSFFQPLNILEIEAVHKKNGNLNTLKEAKPLVHYQTLHTSILKGSLVVFLVEILAQVLTDSQVDKSLYSYLKSSFLWLDLHDDISLFHIVFLLNLTQFLGFFPDNSNSELPQFNLKEGSFDIGSKDSYTIEGSVLKNFKTLLGINFDDISTVSIVKDERMALLKVILLYFTLHIPSFKKLKSLSVLQEVFN